MSYAWLLILLPAAGAIWLALAGRRMSEAKVASIACGAVGAAFVVAVLVLLRMLRTDGAAVLVPGPTWIAVGDLHINFALLLDPLSTVMALVVTGVGFLIHFYGVGYMHGDPHFPRFFALFNLFITMMLTLVLGSSLAMTFIGWEGVGFCSYMLIGYYTERPSAAQAGKKAFIVNRFGDLGFLLGMFLVWRAFGTLEYRQVSAMAMRDFTAGDGAVIAMALCFFVGSCGKSAQFPLYVWLPDAMAGPTPVSALIHAATMVTAGVYLVVRLGILFALAPFALHTVAVIGLLTALMAALLALVQNDIKKVLAYSTVSQLGYMFLAAGVGAYTAAIFHLVTHAFFKGLLFLCSGSVIHAVEHAMHHAHEHSDPQDMRNMGGLAAKLPTTYKTMLVASAAIAGVPLLSGFFSKDEILLHAGLNSFWFQLIGLAVALLTAFYMFRLIFKTFWQTTRMSEAAYGHVEESPRQMTLPLVVLAVLSVLGGLLNLPGHGGISQQLSHFLHPVLASAGQLMEEHHIEFSTELTGMVISSVVALVGIFLAWLMYQQKPGSMAGLAQKVPAAYRALVNLYWLDDLYFAVIVKPGNQAAAWLARVFDQEVLDGYVNGVARFFGASAEKIKLYQPGFVRSYAFWFAVGAVAIVAHGAVQAMPVWGAALVGLLVLALAGSALVVALPRDEG